MKQIRKILLRNFISPISIAIYLLAGGLLYLGEFKDAWFISFVITINSIISSVQEIRAYLTLKKIELMSAPRAIVLKGDKTEEVIFTQLQNDDIIILKTGDEIPADCVVLESNNLEVNESMLTGESIAIKKDRDDKILSSTIVVSGEAKAKVIATGDQTEAGQMTKKLKEYKPTLTPIQRNIQRLISTMTYFAGFLALLIIYRYTILGENETTILKTITSAAVVVVPEGLLLASSLFFAYGSLKLLQAKVLPQKISAIEDMALLDVLATDKTGTLTSPDIIFDNIKNLSSDQKDNEKILFAINSQGKEQNSTAKAILSFLKKNKTKNDMQVDEYLPFSSSRKMSAIKIKNKIYSFGAPEFVLKTIPSNLKKDIEKLASQGLRVLILASCSNKNNQKIEKAISNSTFTPLAIVTLRNSLRPHVKETVEFLQKRGVSLRVISGDNPHTVSYIANSAGIKNSDKFITGSELAKMDKNEFKKTVLNTTIFARVLPEQKERIISVFQKNKLYTGMVGDGVNDALAIKKANLGISMFDSAPATRRVADLVLMDNSFTSLPSGAKIGNRIMLSIEMIAILFFHKIIMGITILSITLFLGENYPFLPRNITYLNFILVTLPTILTTLLPPLPIEKINPKKFWQDTLFSIAPIALISGLSISSIYLLLLRNNTPISQTLGTVAITTAVLGICAYLIAEKILNSKITLQSYQRRGIYILITIIFTFIVFGFAKLRAFFEFGLPSPEKIEVVLGIIAFTILLQIILAKFIKKKKLS